MRRLPPTRVREALDRLLEHVPPRREDFLFSGPSGRAAIALTFDDGPSSSNTPKVLDVLGEYGARGTFFAVGDQVAGNEAILRRLVEERHEIGNHTLSHPHTVCLTTEELREELERTCTLLKPFSQPRLVRPPFGKDRRRVADIGAALGLRMILWSVDSRDTALGDDAGIADLVLSRATAGAIVLMHDGGPPRLPTVRALERVVPCLIRRGFELVTVSELIEPLTNCPLEPAASVSAKGPSPSP